MIKGYFATAMLGLSLIAVPAMAAPVAGDLAFVAINADEDGFALVSFVDLAAGTQLFVTDSEWNGTVLGAGGAFEPGEGGLGWTLGGGLIAGDVVRFSAVDSAANVSVSLGSVSRSGSFSISQSNESLYLYRANGADGVLPLAAVGYGTSFSDELSGSGLEARATILAGTVKFAEYVGSRSGAAGFAAYGESVSDAGLWVKRSGGDASLMAPNLAAFSVAAPVPEPGGYAMLLAGLGVVSAIARRRQGRIGRVR